MAVGFERIPQGIRVPLFYAEISNREASYLQMQQPSLLIGPMLATGIATPLEPVLVRDQDEAAALFGAGSILADMVGYYRRNDPYGALWCIPHVAPTGATAATAAVKVEGDGAVMAATGALYIGGDRYPVAIGAGEAHLEVATKLRQAILDDPFALVTPGALVTAEDDETSFVLSCKTVGAVGNEIGYMTNVRGIVGGEMFPDDIVVTVTPATGSGLPLWPAIITAMGDEEYDFIATPYTDGAALDAIGEELNDIAGRWAWNRQIYGHCFTARTGDLTALQTFGRTRNDPHVSVLGFALSATVSWRRAAALCAQAATSVRADPARPLQTLTLAGVLPPVRGARFGVSSSDILLHSGIATEMEAGGAAAIQRCVTTYQRNQWNQPDPSWLDVQTPFTLMYIIRFLRNRILAKFPRHKLANDGTPFGLGQAIVTPRIIRAELIAAYGELIELGVCENMDGFKEFLVVERDTNDPNRVNVLLPPDLVNQLRIFAMLVEFRLRFRPGAAPGVAAAA